MQDIKMNMLLTPETPKIDVQKDTTRLQNVDGIYPKKIDSQFGGIRFTDPITGLNSSKLEMTNVVHGIRLDENGQREAAQLRIAQSAYIYMSGFNDKIDPDTGQELDLQSSEGFQRWYELSRVFVTSESQKMQAKLSAESKLIPNIDPITKQSLADDSLRLFWILKKQTGDSYLAQDEFDKWEESFKQLTDQYGPAVNMRPVLDAFDETFYQMSFKNLLSNILMIEKSVIIEGINQQIHRSRLSIPEAINRRKLTVNERLRLIPDYIDNALKILENQGIYIPTKSPDDPKAAEYPKGSLERYLLAVDIATGKRPDILEKRKLELELEEKRLQIQAEEANRKKSEQRAQKAHRRATIASAQDLPTHKTPEIGFRKRVGEFVRNTFKVDDVIDLYKRFEYIPRYMVGAAFHTITGDRDKFLDQIAEKEDAIIRQCGLDPVVMDERWNKGAINIRAMAAEWKILAPVAVGVDIVRGYLGFEVRNRNLRLMQTLERKRPGITKALFEGFGIANYARYPVDALVKQYDQRYDRNSDYGIVINPVSDWNGAFMTGKNLYKSLFKQAKRQYLNVRIIEAENKVDLARALLIMRKNYINKITFAIIGGHGTENSINFGGSTEANKLYTKDLVGMGMEAVSGFFKQGATIVLESCSTGVTNGIAQKMSERTGLTVIAPEKPTSLSGIKVKRRKDDAIYMDASYKRFFFSNNRIKRVYENGVLVKQAA